MTQSQRKTIYLLYLASGEIDFIFPKLKNKYSAVVSAILGLNKKE